MAKKDSHPKTDPADSGAAKQRGRPFKKGESGNPAGRPKGLRNKATRAAEILLDGEAAGITRKAVQMAKAGDTTALRLCLERILPPRKDRPVEFDLPPIRTVQDAAEAMATITNTVSAGELSPIEAREISGVIQTFVSTLENSDLEARITALEDRKNG